MQPTEPIHIIGGGLAGCEAAWQIARAGGRAVLYEMRPLRSTEAHKTDRLAELVCSNSLKSEQENTAPWLLKEELRRAGSLLIGQIAPKVRVPAGHALTVDRDLFAEEVTQVLSQEPRIEIRREEVTSLDPDKIWIVASGPLTSDALAAEILERKAVDLIMDNAEFEEVALEESDKEAPKVHASEAQAVAGADADPASEEIPST